MVAKHIFEYTSGMESTIIPVIHILNYEQVLINIETCRRNGIFEVFLISHYCDNEKVYNYAHDLKLKYDDMWVGVNFLGEEIEAIIQKDLSNIDGLWLDKMITSEQYNQLNIEVFAGVAFKYQKQPTDLKEACKQAKLCCDVVTTSGSGTGSAPTDVKISNIKEYLGDFPMAIASGVSPENVHRFNKVDNLLVASSITDKGEIINENRLIELITNLNKSYV